MSTLPPKVEELVKEVFALEGGSIRLKRVEEDPETYLISLLTEIKERMAERYPGQLRDAVEAAGRVKSNERFRQICEQMQREEEERKRRARS